MQFYSTQWQNPKSKSSSASCDDHCQIWTGGKYEFNPYSKSKGFFSLFGVIQRCRHTYVWKVYLPSALVAADLSIQLRAALEVPPQRQAVAPQEQRQISLFISVAFSL